MRMSLGTYLSRLSHLISSRLVCLVLSCLAADLVVDTYLDEVVRSLGEQGLTDDAAEVEIHNDGHWDPILEDQRVSQMRLPS